MLFVRGFAICVDIAKFVAVLHGEGFSSVHLYVVGETMLVYF